MRRTVIRDRLNSVAVSSMEYRMRSGMFVIVGVLMGYRELSTFAPRHVDGCGLSASAGVFITSTPPRGASCVPESVSDPLRLPVVPPPLKGLLRLRLQLSF